MLELAVRRWAFAGLVSCALGACSSGGAECPIENAGVDWIVSGSVQYGSTEIVLDSEPLDEPTGVVACAALAHQTVVTPDQELLLFCTTTGGEEFVLEAIGEGIFPSVEEPLTEPSPIPNAELYYTIFEPGCDANYRGTGQLTELDATGTISQPGAEVSPDFFRRRQLVLSYTRVGSTTCDGLLDPETIEFNLILEAGPDEVIPEGRVDCEGVHEN